MVSCKYERGKTVSQHDKGTTALKYPSGRRGVRYSFILYDSSDGLYPKIHLPDYSFYILYLYLYFIFLYFLLFILSLTSISHGFLTI
jgi:Zn/Cd-binding protein ZinT